MTTRVLDRIGTRKLLQRTGVVEESTTPLASDPDEVAKLLDARWYAERVDKLAAEFGRGGVPIVPIVIRNAGELMWRRSMVINPGIADVRRRFTDTLDDWPTHQETP